MSMDNISIDLETLDKKYSSAIISIGAVAFDPVSGKLGETFYREIDFDSAMRSGTVSGDTLAWWTRQTDKARRIFGTENKTSLPTALDEFCRYVRKMPQAEVWGNGATFDITILEHAIDLGSVGVSIPWNFLKIRDMRTIVAEAGHYIEWPEKVGVHHNALDDAIYQAQAIIRCKQFIAKAIAAYTGKEEEL